MHGEHLTANAGLIVVAPIHCYLGARGDPLKKNTRCMQKQKQQRLRPWP